MKLKRVVIAVAVVLLQVSAIRAEKASMSPAKLRETATHVVVGKVSAIFSRQQTVGDWKYTNYVAEITVDKIEKGEKKMIKTGELAYVRYWKRTWIGEGKLPTSTTGHRGLPSAGDTVRVYLARNAYDGFTGKNMDGGFNVIGANGFEKIKSAATTKR